MGKISKNAAVVGARPYSRVPDTQEAELVGMYAADLGHCIFAWNTAISALFFIFLGTALKEGVDPQATWFKFGSDRARLEATAKRLRASDIPSHVIEDGLWFIERMIAAIEHRNAITHLGLNYLPGDIGPDPYGKPKHIAIVRSLLDNPGSLSAIVGDLRVLSQFAQEVGLQAVYPSMADSTARPSRPPLLSLDTLRDQDPQVGPSNG